VAGGINDANELLRVTDIAIRARATKATTSIRTAFLATALALTSLQNASKVWGAILIVIACSALAIATIVATFLPCAIRHAIFDTDPAFAKHSVWAETTDAPAPIWSAFESLASGHASFFVSLHIQGVFKHVLVCFFFDGCILRG
jgi:hypothetical protein